MFTNATRSIYHASRCHFLLNANSNWKELKRKQLKHYFECDRFHQLKERTELKLSQVSVTIAVRSRGLHLKSNQPEGSLTEVSNYNGF